MASRFYLVLAYPLASLSTSCSGFMLQPSFGAKVYADILERGTVKKAKSDNKAPTMSGSFEGASVWKSPSVVEGFLNRERGAVPLAREQIDVMLRVARHFQPDPKTWLDLGCGDAVLGRALLQEFPTSNGVLLDFSEPMLVSARRHVGDDGRVRLVQADFSHPEWVTHVSSSAPYDVIVSGFAIHHLSDRRKQDLYSEIHDVLAPGGVFLNLEHVSSPDEEVEEIWAGLYVDALVGHHRELNVEKSRAEIADEFHYNAPDKDADIRCAVELQCDWLRKIGYDHVDCFFKIFVVALFGGVKSKREVRSGKR